MTAPPTKSTLLHTFLDIEQSFELFEQDEAGVHFWEMARYPLYRDLLVTLGLEAPSSEHEPKTITWWIRFLKLVLFANRAKDPRTAPRGAVVCYGHPRRKLENGVYLDIYLDPLIELLEDENFVVLERPLGWLTHLEPAATRNLFHLDRLLIGPMLKRRLFGARLSPACRALCKRVEQQLNDRLGTHADVAAHISNVMARWHYEVPTYRRLLERLQPKAVLQVVSGGNETFVAAAHELGLEVAELQHGSPARGKLNYDYPDGYRKRTFPDFFWSFGPYWTRQVRLPLPDEHIVPIGFPYMAKQREKYRDVTREDQLLVISQPAVADHLTAFIVQLARYLRDSEESVRIVYKIHPQETRSLPIYDELQSLGVRLEDRQSDLYALFAESRWQLGVYSTAIYEGISMGCTTFILDAPGAEFMQPLIDAGHAKRVTQPQDVVLADNPAAAPADDLFCRVDREHIRSTLERLIS